MKIKILLIVLPILAVIALFLAIKPQSNTSTQPGRQESQSQQQQQVKTFTLELRGNELVSGDDVLQIAQGDEVRIEVTSDTAGSVHLHGYDKVLKLRPNTPAEISFKAERAGRFEAELEDISKTIFALEVQPK